MTTTFTSKQIGRFKREAKAIEKATGCIHARSLDIIAERENFGNWSLLMKASRTNASSAKKSVTLQSVLTFKTLLDVCQRFIKSLEEHTIYTLCWNGSLWIDKSAVLNGNLTINNLNALGPRGDSRISQYGSDIGSVLLTDFDGLAELFVLDTDEDDNGNPIEPGPSQLLYTPDTGRRELLDCIQRSLEADFEAVLVCIEDLEALD
jgi:hypothetical protein